ncbi:MAG TPA: hypothetical protein VF595_06125, partial [Tepidisphaeraceae bacterium]
VIGIIGVLIGILFPVVSRVRLAGQKVATQNTINRLTQGIEAYFQDFGSFPGPFADSQLVSSEATTPPGRPTLPGGQSLQIPNPTSPGTYMSFGNRAPTTSENLFLGLCGGLRVVVKPGPTVDFVYDPDYARRGKGPSGLSTSVAKKSQTYLEITDADISASEENRNPLVTDAASPSSLWWPGAPAGPAAVPPFVGDSQIYEFMDRFARPRPILYMRAQRGVTKAVGAARSGFIYDPTSPATKSETDPWQYRPDQIQYAYSNIGVDRAKVVQAGKPWSADVIDYPHTPVDPASPAAGANIKFSQGNERYFVNEQISTGNPVTTGVATNTLVPVYKDKYILISAGADGLYGTADDIRN